MPRIATLLLLFAQSSQVAALSELLTKMEQYETYSDFRRFDVATRIK